MNESSTVGLVTNLPVSHRTVALFNLLFSCGTRNSQFLSYTPGRKYTIDQFSNLETTLFSQERYRSFIPSVHGSLFTNKPTTSSTKYMDSSSVKDQSSWFLSNATTNSF